MSFDFAQDMFVGMVSKVEPQAERAWSRRRRGARPKLERSHVRWDVASVPAKSKTKTDHSKIQSVEREACGAERPLV